jgi:hypothetical protein
LRRGFFAVSVTGFAFASRSSRSARNRSDLASWADASPSKISRAIRVVTSAFASCLDDLDEAETLGGVEELYGSSCHVDFPFKSHRTSPLDGMPSVAILEIERKIG